VDEHDLVAWLEANDVFSVRVESVQLDGWLFGKFVSPSKLIGGLTDGIATADLATSYDLGGSPMLGWWDDWRGEIGDIVHRLDLTTLTMCGGTPGMATVFADLEQLDGRPVPIDPRSTLKRLVQRLAACGYEAKVALEIEAYVFSESIEDARAKGFSGLTPLGDPSGLGYSVGGVQPLVDYMDLVARRVHAHGIDWEGWSIEIGPGQIEFNVAPTDPVSTADAVMRVKTVMRQVADELSHSVTFMSKPIDSYANGLHVNHSLLRDGEPVFPDHDQPDGRSTVMRRWLGGLMVSIPASMSFFSPFPTSYRRLKEADGPPTTVTWGENNKSTGIRAITRSAKATRLEHRVPAGDANPYLAIAAVLAAGIRGLEDELDPPPEFTHMAWMMPRSVDVERLPNTITKAAVALAADERFSEIMGPELVRHWLETRRWEWLMFHTTGGDPDEFTGRWELERYFERV